jgi:hypothetical protein
MVVGLAASGLVWGQSLPAPPVSQPAGKTITVTEPGKPAQKCRLLQQWTEPNGAKACQVQVISTGEMMTIVQSGPAVSEVAPGSHAKTMAMRIYHWRGMTPHPEAPMPPVVIEAAPIQRGPMPTIETAPSPIIRTGNTTVAVQQGPTTASPVIVAQGQPASAAPMVVTPSHASSIFTTAPGGIQGMQGSPMPAPTNTGTATIQLMGGPPDRAPGPMTPGGVVLTPAPAGKIQEFSGNCGTCGTCGDCCVDCKPSLIDRIKAHFHKDTCTTCCPETCTTCSPDSHIPAKTANGETIVPVPTTDTATAPPVEKPRPISGLFHRNKPMETITPAMSETVKSESKAHVQAMDGSPIEMPKTEAKKSDPLSDPAAYSAPKTAAELAGAPLPPPPVKAADLQSQAAAAAANGKVPLGAGSVIQAGGDPKYLPVPVVTLPNATRPPMVNPPQAPQPNRPLQSNAFGAPPAPMPIQEMSGNAFGPPPQAVQEMASSAFNQGNPNVAGYGRPMIMPPGYGAVAQGQYLPPMPVGPVVQPGFYGPPRGQMVAPAGYQAPMMPMQQAPAPIYNGPTDMQSLLQQLRDSMLPSQREWAADKLASLDWRTHGPVVAALVQSAKEDPAATVRAGCIRSLVKMNANTAPVLAVIQSLKTDTDPRVQHEASEALARFAPAQGPGMADPNVQPASYSPARSN